MVYHSIDHGNDLTCHAEPVVLFLVFRKNNFSPQHGQRRTKFLTYGDKFLVFVCMTTSFIAQISSSENVAKRVAILAPVAPQKVNTGTGKGNTVHERYSGFLKSESRFVLINLVGPREKSIHRLQSEIIKKDLKVRVRIQKELDFSAFCNRTYFLQKCNKYDCF